ncbi:hypothetical protein LEP1GSC170_2468 [Leptospira interrogans serovar Bataviae str. HAI135]|nr:hypothetical protein LEP1GSC170_2468 [Leptospira interrogans serovar Bataviae str. HAI135]
MLKIWFNMDLALLSTRSFSFFPPYAELTLNYRSYCVLLKISKE